MAPIQNTQAPNARKRFSVLGPEIAAPASPPAQDDKVRRTTGLCPTSHLTVDQYLRLLACIEREGGIAPLDEIARALPAVARPISAVFDLCDAGILSADLEAALDGNMRVWRLDR